MNTTAIYSNRQEDKLLLEDKLGLEEFENSNILLAINQEPYDIILQGYRRIVYGDHGPYLEFNKEQLKLALVSKFGNQDMNHLPSEKDCKYYYYWLHPINYPHCKIYLQLKSVANLPNAPKRPDGKRSKFNRLEGYADYQRGYYYVDPYQLKKVEL